MKYIITENILKRLVDKLRGKMSKEESERRIKKLVNIFITHNLNKLEEGEVSGYVRGWYLDNQPVIGVTHNNKINFNQDLEEELTQTFGVTTMDARQMMANWMINNHNLGNVTI